MKRKVKLHKFFLRKDTLAKCITGKVTPGNTPVQVYVQASDMRWYLQRPAVVFGSKWSCHCHFGKDQPYGDCYTVVAVMTDERPSSPIDTLPEGVVKSNMVRARRI